MSEAIKVAFATGTDDLNRQLIARMQALYPELPLHVVSEFPAAGGTWVPYCPRRSFRENYSRCRAAFRGKRIRLAGVMLVPNVPHHRLRLIALLLSPSGLVAYNENLDHFMLRPRCLGLILRHVLWRTRNLAVFELRPGGRVYTFFWRLVRPREWRRPLAHLGAALGGLAATLVKALAPARSEAETAGDLPEGISVVIPSRNGKDLLASLLPGVMRDLEGIPSEVIVVDNGSEDATEEFLNDRYPGVLTERSAAPLSFARAVNRGIRRARYSHLCLLNNDMVIEPGFFALLRRAFDCVPDLFCATAQIFFPGGARREETGKAVMPPRETRAPEDFPVRCELPVAGEDLSYVLYGSGGCSMYSTAKLRSLGGLDEIYEPAYVEDMDLGYRAWRRGWPTVFVAGARVLHHHRATTSRYYSGRELEVFLESNYLRFLARCVGSAKRFRRLWREALRRLDQRAACKDSPALPALARAWQAPFWTRRSPAAVFSDELVLGIGSGLAAVFPGRPPSGRPVVLVASPYLPFPLSHGGAVRMYNLMRRAAADYDQVLVSFVDELAPPPPELLGICVEIVQVKRLASHLRPSTARPDAVEEFDSPAFRAALRQTVRKWNPAVAQLEFTQMAQYASDCTPARTVLVEHDITFDLQEQLARQGDWEARRQYRRWLRFETAAWRQVDCVVVMSEKDRRAVSGRARSVCLANGVNLERFRPAETDPEPGRLLFIGSFAHMPNVLAVEFFLREVWPELQDLSPSLHVIAGSRHAYHLERYRERARVNLNQARVEVEDFVPDVRRAYRRAAIVIAPLQASAGTNIKILEAMAMGKAIVSTQAGVNGLELAHGHDVLVANTAGEFSAAIRGLLADPARREALGRNARATAERDYDWDVIARRQRELYESLRHAERVAR